MFLKGQCNLGLLVRLSQDSSGGLLQLLQVEFFALGLFALTIIGLISGAGLTRGILAGALGSNPAHQPFGVQKMAWDPKARRFASAWVNTTVSSPNGVPYVSLATRQVYFVGARNNRWTLEALDWKTGRSTFHYVIGGQRYNSQYSCPVPDGMGGIMYGSTWGRVRLVPRR